MQQRPICRLPRAAGRSFFAREGPLRSPICRRSALHPGDFLMRRKSPKTHQEPPGSWTSGTRGRTPLDSPAPCPSGIVRGGLNPQASSGAILPGHGLKTESVPSMKPEEKTRPVCPLSSKWQIGLGQWQKPYRGGGGNAAGGAKRPPQGIPKGAALGAPLVTFPASGKSPGAWGGAPIHGRSAEEGVSPPRKGSAEGCTGGVAPRIVQKKKDCKSNPLRSTMEVIVKKRGAGKNEDLFLRR